MAVTARFKVNRITRDVGGPGVHEIEMTPDYGEGRNEDWKAASPSGVIRLTVGNPSAIKQFESRSKRAKEGQAEWNSRPVHVLFEFPDE